ncbi:unnamed protein product [Psylliodes chrysocephalus]|uniref:Annexin n=1 Tax=Psylliodes chrysocephalus TaxID=3402493 RepID=A0A9P0CLL0_9CUCU|nr:unnamed protein product [Psylliodes chrysocephala]
MIGHPIEEAIENEFSGSTKDAYLSLIRSIRDRTMYLATRLHDAMAGLGTDDRTLIRIIVSRSEIDLAEIKEAYEAKYSKSLYERISPTVTLWPNFKEDEDAQILRDSLDGLGTNEDAVIEILTRRTNEQRRRIVTAYKTMFGEDLVEDLKGDLGGDFEDVILALLKDPLEYQTEELHKAISGMGTDDPTLVEILVIHDDDEIKQITEKYQEMYDTSLEDAIKGDETGTLQRLLVSLSTGGRDESSQVDRDGAIADAQNLYDAGESSWGTEESVFNSILCIRNRNQLRLIFDEYETMIGHSIEDAIENEFSGSTKDAYLSLVMSIRDRPMYLATRLHDAMAGMGTDDRTLIRIIVSRSEIDLAEIKEAYEAKYSKSLYERVSDAATIHLKVAIIDKDNPYGKITTEREILVKKTLMGELNKTILSASCSKTKPPTFRSWIHSDEIIRVTCDDDLTLEWLKTKVPTLKTREGATIAVVRMDELPQLTKASFWFPGEAQVDFEKKEVVIRRLEGKNPNLHVAK